VASIHQSSLKAVDEFTVRTYVFKEDIVLFVKKMSHYLLHQRLKYFINFLLAKYILYTQCHIAHYHRKRETFYIPPACAFTPLSFWIVLPPLNASIGLESELSIVIILGSFIKFCKGHGCKAVGKDAVWFADGFAISRNREVP
jgi:hypothetical protein